MYSRGFLIIVGLIGVGFAYIGSNPLPASYGKKETQSNQDRVDYDQVVDQRQNGSENVRIHMNDLTLMVAPSEGILQLMSASGNDLAHADGSVSGLNSSPAPLAESSTAHATNCVTESAVKCKHQNNKK